MIILRLGGKRLWNCERRVILAFRKGTDCHSDPRALRFVRLLLILLTKLFKLAPRYVCSSTTISSIVTIHTSDLRVKGVLEKYPDS